MLLRGEGDGADSLWKAKDANGVDIGVWYTLGSWVVRAGGLRCGDDDDGIPTFLDEDGVCGCRLGREGVGAFSLGKLSDPTVRSAGPNSPEDPPLQPTATEERTRI